MQQDKFPRINQGKRALVAGRTGSGKSTLARWLLNRSPGHWVILNPKHTKAFDSLPGAVTINKFDLKKLENAIHENRFVIFNPPTNKATPEILDEFVMWLHENFRNVGLCVDELYALHNSARAGEGLIGWLTRGRELKQSFLGLTQRPAWLSQFLFSESDFIGEMSLSLDADRKRMREMIGRDETLRKLDPHYWLWYDAEADSLRSLGPVPK